MQKTEFSVSLVQCCVSNIYIHISHRTDILQTIEPKNYENSYEHRAKSKRKRRKQEHIRVLRMHSVLETNHQHVEI